MSLDSDRSRVARGIPAASLHFSCAGKMAGKQSPEYETFAKLQEDLRVGIQSDIEAVAGRAFSGGLITPENLEELTIQGTAKHIRARSFLMMIGNKIKECPTNIGKFKHCLDPHVHQNLVKKIGKSYL